MSNEEVETTFELHQCIAFDDISKARSLIWNLCQDEKRGLTKAYQEFGIRPAIFVAIERDNREFVEFLLHECYADIEEQLSNENPIGLVSSSPMSPLEFANFTEKYTIFELLLSSGADPTRLINDRKIKASIWGNDYVSLQSLQILSDLGADIKTADDDGLSCLMHAVEHFDRCRFLVEKGVDVNFKNKNGDTALHCAVKCGRSDTVKLLLENGAEPCSKNNEGYSPLHLACINGFEEIVELLLEAITDKSQHVEAYQLLGLNFDDTTKAIYAWRKAVELSSTIPNQTSPATLNTPFGIAVEATSVSELDALEQDPGLFLMQTMVLCHKIFGQEHDLFFSSIESHAIYLYQLNSFERLLRMLSFWLRAICDSSLPEARRCSYLKTFFTMFDFSVKDSNTPQVAVTSECGLEFFEAVLRVLPECTGILNRELRLDLLSHGFLGEIEDCYELAFHRLGCSAVEFVREWCERTVLIDMLSRWLRCGAPSSLLLNAITSILKCGADVDERDQDGNNVVHFLLESRKPENAKDLKEIAAKFVENGVHLDSRNRRGNTTAVCLKNLGIRVTPPISLMCLAARVIRRHKIPVQGILTKVLIDFVEMH